MNLLATLVTLFGWCVIGRAIFSWVRVDPQSPWGQLERALVTITEPVIAPVRSLLPRTAMIDFSPLIVLILCQILSAALRGGRVGLF